MADSAGQEYIIIAGGKSLGTLSRENMDIARDFLKQEAPELKQLIKLFSPEDWGEEDED